MRLFINPGGDLLSRDLSSDYHRRSNVSLPGSEWDRVGPLGYDHQVSDALLRGLLPIWLSLALGLLWLCTGAALRVLQGKQADIRVAMCVGFQVLRFFFESSLCCSKLATEGGMRSIGC